MLRRAYSLALMALARAPTIGEWFRKSRLRQSRQKQFLMALILIVEDDVFIRDDAEAMIQGWGHKTLSAGDVGEALSHLHSPQPIDALFTDVCLKRALLGGYEIAHEAIKLRRNLRVLYTTGHTVNDKMKTFFVEGAHFLQKPYTQLQLQNSVEGLLAA